MNVLLSEGSDSPVSEIGDELFHHSCALRSDAGFGVMAARGAVSKTYSVILELCVLCNSTRPAASEDDEQTTPCSLDTCKKL